MPEQHLEPHGIKWSEVTWYSKAGALIVFVVIVPALSFYIGMQFEDVRNDAKSVKSIELATNRVSQDLDVTESIKPAQRVAYFGKLSDPRKGVLVVQTDIEGTDITGWSIKSNSLGKSFLIGEVYFNGVKRHVILSAGGGAFIIGSGLPSESYSAEGEYHVYLGSPDFKWDTKPDTIQLLGTDGLVADTLNFDPLNKSEE